MLKDVISPTTGHWKYYILCVLPSLTQTCQQGYFKWMQAPPVQEDFDFLILLNIIVFILYTAETFLKVNGFFVVVILRCSVLFWF